MVIVKVQHATDWCVYCILCQKLLALKIGNTVNLFHHLIHCYPVEHTECKHLQWQMPANRVSTFNLKKYGTNHVPNWLKMGHNILFFTTGWVTTLPAISHLFHGTSTEALTEKPQQQIIQIKSAFSYVMPYHKICLFFVLYIYKQLISICSPVTSYVLNL